MSVSDILKAAGEMDALKKGGAALLVVCTLLQFAPVKINPWSWIGKLIAAFFRWLAGKIGKAINGEVIEKLGGIGGKLAEVENRLDALEVYNKSQDAKQAEEKALAARRRILRFGDEVRNKVRHSKEHFDNIFEDIKYYKDYCTEHEDFENDKVQTTIEIIKETYARCIRENDFL